MITKKLHLWLIFWKGVLSWGQYDCWNCENHTKLLQGITLFSHDCLWVWHTSSQQNDNEPIFKHFFVNVFDFYEKLLKRVADNSSYLPCVRQYGNQNSCYNHIKYPLFPPHRHYIHVRPDGVYFGFAVSVYQCEHWQVTRHYKCHWKYGPYKADMNGHTRRHHYLYSLSLNAIQWVTRRSPTKFPKQKQKQRTKIGCCIYNF